VCTPTRRVRGATLGSVDPLLRELRAIVDEAEREGVAVMVIGAYALRTYLADPEGRKTSDLDLLVRGEARGRITDLLGRRGFHVYPTGPWLRAERAGEGPRIVDVAIDAIVDMASFERYPLDPSRATRRAEPGGPEIPVPALEDLVAQKLIAAREKDILDVVLVAAGGSAVDPRRIADAVDARDVEVAVRRGYLELQAAARSGRLQQLWLERVGTPLAWEDLASALSQIASWFGEKP